MEYQVAPAMLEHARRWLALPAEERQPVPPKPSATVALVRDGVDGIECYLQWRPMTMKFAAGYAAFPGGSAEPHDADLTVTAIREVFEETGVLLADAAGNGPTAEQLEDARARVEVGEPLAPVVDELGLRLRPERLTWWMRRITPEFSPVRFDTVFFVATLNPGDDPRPLTSESERSSWVRCAQALAGEPLMQPTRIMLESLTAHRSVTELTTAERDRTPVMGRLVEGSEPPRLNTDPAFNPGSTTEQAGPA